MADKNTDDKVRVVFTKTRIYETDGPKKGPTFKEGSTYKMDRAFANRWVRRGVAVIHPEDAEAAMAGRAEEVPGAKVPAEVKAKIDENRVQIAPELPAGADLDGMTHAQLGEVLAAQGYDEAAVNALRSKEDRRKEIDGIAKKAAKAAA